MIVRKPRFGSSFFRAFTRASNPPDTDRRTSCLSAEKWRDIAHYTMEFLGFGINTRTMMVRWPVAKRLALKKLLIEEH